MIMALFLGSAYVLPSQGRAGPLSEGFEGDFPPEGWTLQSTGDASAPWTQSATYAHTGTYSACGNHTSAGYTNEWLITPRLDLSSKLVDTLEFWKRFNPGSQSYPDTLEILLSEDGGSTWPTQLAIWTPDSSSDGDFVQVFLSLSSTSDNVKIAFRYGSDWGYNSYIDDVTGPEVFTAGDDMATQSIDNPSDGAALEGNSSVSVQATVKNVGANTQNNVPVHLEIDDGAGYTYTDVEYTGTLNQDDTELITFIPDWTVPNTVAGYTIKVWTALAKADGNPDNDTVTISVSSYPEGYTVEGFEDPTFPPEGWAQDPGGNWSRYSGYAHSGSYSARGSGEDAFLFTPQLALGKGNDVLKFWYRAESASYPCSLFVRLSTSADQTDTSAYTTMLAKYYVNSTTYQEGEIDLGPYARISKGQVYIAFNRQWVTATYWYMFLDDVMLPPIYVPADDMATISIDNPTDGAELAGNSSVSVQATVKNVGINPQSSVPVHLEITDGASYSYTDVELTGTLNQNDTEQITFDPDWTVPNVLAGYTIKVWTALAKADGNPDNDTVTISVSAMPEGYTVESFEDLPFPPPGWDMGPGTDDWARSSGSAHSGSYKARARGQNAWLFTPPLKVESGDALRFWYRAESSSHPTSFYVRLSTSADQSDTTGYTTFLADYPNITSTTYLEGNIDLSPYKGIVYIAFHRYYCDVDYYYLYLDDVALPPFPIQIVVSPDSFYIESFPDETFDDYLYIGNLGGGQLDYDIELTSGGKVWLEVDPTSGSALGGEEDTITLSFNTAGLDGHYYDSLRIISNSDMKGVDTVLVPVHLYVRLIPEISISPDSFAVGVTSNSTEDTSMFISNTGTGQLDYDIETEEWGKFGAMYMGEPASRRHGEAFKSKIDKEPEKGMEDYRRGVPPEKGMGGPDAFGYRWIDSDEPGGPTYSWVEISGVGTQLTMGDDDNQGPFDIGFTFNFYGNDFTQLYICSNGFVSFTSTDHSYGNDPIPYTDEPNNLLALFWDDLTGSDGYVYYYNDGSRFIIEYDEVHRLGCSECLYTMEVILYPNGKIIYQYHTMGGDRLDEATIGIENEDGTDGLEVVFNAEYMHDELAIRFSAAPDWLVFSPESGTVPPSETDTIDVTFDATGIMGGDFYGAFLINSNDPETPQDTVPAHMTILTPDMTFDPDSIVASCTEGQGVQHQTMNIGNAGDGTLIFNIVEGAPWLSVSPDAGSVAPGDPATAIDLAIDCSDLYAGNYIAELEVYSNDPDQQPYALYKVYLHVGPDPDIDVSPDSFYVGLYAGLSKDTTMTISNTGDGHLVWGIAIEELSPPKSPDTLLWEGFEDEWPPTGWSDPDDWVQECVYYAHTGLCGAYLVWGYGLDEWLITPAVTLGAGSYLKFWWESSFTWSVDPYDNADLFVKISTNGGSSWETLWTFGDSADVVNSGGPWPWGQFEWVEATLDLSAYTGNALIAFHVVADDNADIAIDDVVVESFGAPWLTVYPTSGVIEPGKGSADVTLSFSSIGVTEDKYANMWVTSNDPDEDPVLVPVHLEILGPEYSISPPETLVIEATEDAYTDGHLFVSNFGGHAPLIFKMTDPVAWLSESPDSEDVAIDGTQDVIVTVDGYQLIAGDYETFIAIETNDFDEGYDTIVVIVHMGPDPCIAVDPESFDVQVSAGGTKDTTLTITNDCDGHLAFEISFEETGGPLLIGAPGGTYQDRILDEVQKRNAEGFYKSAVTGTGGARLIDKSNPAHLTALELGSPGMGGSLPGSPVMGKGDTVFIQLPHDPDESWSFGTSDQGAGYKLCENFWGVTLPISDIHFWGLCLIYSAGWFPGDPNNLVFDITFYSDPPGEIEPPTEVVCTYQDVVPTVVPTGLFYTTSAGTFEMYSFEGVELSPLCNLSEGWVSIESKSAGEGYDWLLWASAKTGDGLSCQVGEGADCPRYYDQAMILTGGMAWLTVSPEADTVDPLTDVEVTVHFDATEILGGEKFGNIIIDHNAPDKGTTIVPVHMVIGGAYYAIDPEELHVEVLEDWVADSTLKVSNPGGEAALSYKMTCPVPWLTINPDTADVDPDQELSVSVRVNGTMLIAGDYYTEIAVKTNAVNQQHDTIPVFVHVGPDPDIDVVPMSLKVSVIPGCSMEKSVKMSNLGLGHLGFETSIGQTPPILAPGESDVREALEALRQAGKANPTIVPKEAYKVIGAKRLTVEYTSTGTSEGLLLLAGGDKQAEILLVDDDGGLPGGTYTDIEYAYTDALDAGGYVYDYYVVDWTDPLSSGPDLTTMQAYSVVIWFTGETWGYYGYDVLTLNDETNLAAYLDGGGNLFLSAQDYLYASYPSAGSFSPGQFPYDYLHLSSVSQDAISDPYTATGGVGSVAEGMQFETLRCYDNPDVPLWTDYLYGQARAVNVFEVPGGVSAVQYDAGDFKTVFTTTEFCGLVDGSPSYRAEFMAAVVDWMLGAGCPFSVTPESGIVDPESSEDLILTFDGDAFPQCEDGVPPETLTCYLSISSNDPDEPVVSVEVDMWSGRGDVMDPTCLIQLGDVVFLINFVYRDGPAPDPLCTGDCNPPHDGLVDVEDVMYLIQYLFEGGMPPLAVPTSTPTPMERK